MVVKKILKVVLIVLLALIQVGGLGFMTIITLFSFIFTCCDDNSVTGFYMQAFL